MDETDFKNFTETTYYRYCRDVSGNMVPLDVARQNGRLVPRFPQDIREACCPREGQESLDYVELVEEVCQCLNGLERRRRLMAIRDELSISEIALIEGVSRQAVIDSFHRMARKNPYVEIWRGNKNQKNQHG